MSKEREHIEKIRKEKFWLDEKGQLSKENPLIDDLINSIARLSEGLYSKDTHFIFELIQNAEDNEYYKGTEPSISFRLVKADPTNTPNSVGALIVQNNEIGFSPDNVDAICAIGKTTKSKLQGYIGEKGIGFKSVFRITTIPHIFSNGYQFCFPEKDEKTSLGYIVPRWIKDIPHGVDPKQTTIILPLDKPDFGYERIEGMLQDIEPETILFLSKLKEIQIKTDGGDNLTILKDDKQSPLIQLLIEGTKHGELYSVREFLLFTQTVDRPRDVRHEKRIDIDKRDVTIAFPADDNKNSIGKIFAYLPVRSDTGFPFLINADFILPSSREDIQDVSWNRWLMKCLANLLAEKLQILKEKNLLTVQLLETLAKRMNELDESSMFYPIVEAVRDALLDQELLPTDYGTFVSARNAKLARGAELRKLLTHDQLRELFQSDDDIKWLSGEITQDRTPDLRSYLMSELDVEEIRPETFIELLTDEFLQAQTDTWIIQFYNFLGNDKSELWKKPDSILRKKKIKFLRLEDNSHVIPFQSDGRPNAYLPSSSKTNFPTIKKNIFEDKSVEEFLRNLGLIEPDLFAEVIELLPKYADTPISLDSQKNIEDLRKISKILSAPLRSEAKNSIGKLKILLSKLGLEGLELEQIEPTKLIPVFLKMVLPSIKFLRAINGNREAYKAAKEIYSNTDELHMYFENNPNVWFVAKSYPEDLEPLFRELSVGESPRVKRKDKNNKGYIVIQKSHGWHKRGLNGFDPGIEIDKLEYALNRPTTEKSEFIWNKIVLPNADCIRGIVESSSRKTYEDSRKEEQISKNFGRLLMDTPWLPDKQGNFHKPAELKLDDLPESFVRDEKLANQLGMKKDVLGKLAEEAGIPLNVLERVKRYAEAPPEIQKQIDSLLSRHDGKQSEFPQKASSNVDRRRKKIIEKYHKAPKKKYEKKPYSKKATANTIDPKIWLRETYTKEGRMICQICKNEMPFKKKDGQYYFEAVELLSDFDREMEELYIALCPLCAAMYNEFVKHDEGAVESLKNALINSEDAEVPLQLGELNTSLRFVKIHFDDINTILQTVEMRP